MRKNYFAKKLIAYSMAFAVAFSTLTVSPVFVKEAKAEALKTITVASTDTVLNGNDIILGPMESVKAVEGGISLTPAEFKQATGLDNVLAAEITESNVTEDYVADYTLKATTLGSASTVNVSSSAKATPVIFNGKTRVNSVQDATKEDLKGNKNVVLDMGSATATAWFKLVKDKTTFTRSYDEAGTTKTENVTVNYYKVAPVSTSTDGKYTFGEVNADNVGIYMGVTLVGGETTTATTYTLFNVYEESDVTAVANQSNIKVNLGDTATLGVTATSTRKDLTYTWTKAGTKLTYNTANFTISDIKDADLGTYVCTVNDGLTNATPVQVTLTKATYADKATINYTNVVKCITPSGTDDGKLVNGKVTLTSCVPSQSDYVYVWRANDTSKVDLSEDDVLGYDAMNNSITITKDDTSYDDASIDCYVLYARDYEALTNVKTALANVKKATTTITKHTALSGLLDAEQTDIATIKTKAIYKETFLLKDTNDTLYSSENIVKNVGDEVKLTAATVDYTLGVGETFVYNDNDNGSAESDEVGTKDFTLTNIYDEFGSYKFVTAVDGNSNGDGETVKAIKFANVIYNPNLTASGSDLTVKVGSKAKFAVNSTSQLPVDYTWTKQGMLSAITESTSDQTITNEFTVQNGDIYVPQELNDDGTEKIAENNYVLCTVTNGIETKVVKLKINKIGGFVIRNSAGVVKTTDFAEGIDSLKNREVTLTTDVTPNSGSEVTFAWYKGSTATGTPIATNEDLTVLYDETNPQYVCVVADKDTTDKITITYTITTVAAGDDDAKVGYGPEKLVYTYTGKAIEPVKVTYDDALLIAGTDYDIEYIDNVNVGTAFYEITFKGDFAKLTKITKDDVASNVLQFNITKADSELVIADNTVVLGESVQPKTTTNLSKAALTYTYFADVDCTTEIAVPTKVGTYYVKATSAATLNYNEAESNVATVKVVPGKVKMLGTSRTASSVKLNWNKATGATSYRVYYKAPGDKSYKVFKNTTATSMDVTGLASATTYTFAVKAYAKTAGYSTVYATKITTTAPAKVATPSVTAGSKKATVKFTKVARATGYQIYMAKGNGKYVKVKTTTSTSFTKTGLAKGATYKFKVRAYKTVGSNTYYGAFSSAKAVVVK